MTTRRLHLASEALTASLDSLWAAERELDKARGTCESARGQHQFCLKMAHERMAEFKEATEEWNVELGP